MDAIQELQELEHELEACHLHGVREYFEMADLLDRQAETENSETLRLAAARVRAQGRRYLEAHRCSRS